MELEREANSVENEAIQVPKHIIDHKFVKEAIQGTVYSGSNLPLLVPDR